MAAWNRRENRRCPKTIWRERYRKCRTNAVDSATLDGRARPRLGARDERRQRGVCGVPAGLPRVSRRTRSAASRRTLVEDHLSRCAACRAHIGGTEGRAAGHRHAAAVLVAVDAVGHRLAAAAAVLLGVLYLGRDTIDAMMAPGGPRATVVSAGGGLYRLASASAEARRGASEGSLEPGAAIGERESVRTGPGAHAVLRLADGSMVDVNERTELLRDRRLERPGHSPPARRRHRQGGQAAPRPPAGPDP